MTWTAVYARHLVYYRKECDSRDEALDFLNNGEDENTLSGLRIVSPTGDVLEGEALFQEAMRRKDALRSA